MFTCDVNETICLILIGAIVKVMRNNSYKTSSIIFNTSRRESFDVYRICFFPPAHSALAHNNSAHTFGTSGLREQIKRKTRCPLVADIIRLII